MAKAGLRKGRIATKVTSDQGHALTSIRPSPPSSR
jgi:hypothetical protein